MKNYSKTFVGVAIVVIGWFGLADAVSESELSTLVDSVVVVVGLVTTIYGRVKATGKVSWLGMKE
jgi:hypothetical protein